MAETEKHTSETAIKKQGSYGSTVQKMKAASLHITGPASLASADLQGRAITTPERNEGGWRRLHTVMSGHRCHSPLLAELMNYTTHSHVIAWEKQVWDQKNRKRRSKNRKMQFISGNSMLLSVTNLSQSNWLQNENKIKVKPWRHGSCPYPPPGPLPKFFPFTILVLPTSTVDAFGFS